MKSMEITQAIELLSSFIGNPSKGLPEEIFLFISKITPLVNVDLLIKDEQNRTLLTWRDDGFASAGWHLPGGIIRYKETLADRIKAVAKNELRALVDYNPVPLATKECLIKDRQVRGHFSSFLYQCRLIDKLDESLKYNSEAPHANQWLWHSNCPCNIISAHNEMYREFI